MLLLSNYILNQTSNWFQDSVFPYIHNFSNLRAEEDAFQEVKFPDVLPSEEIKPGTEFSMIAGEFVDVYKVQLQEWDCIVTLFFMDTAHNILEYIKVIKEILKKGGVWINLGPLLYHYTDMIDEIQLELPWDILWKHIEKEFDFIEEPWFIQMSYTDNERSMMHTSYDCIFFACKLKVNNV